jgi:hypothetical protein
MKNIILLSALQLFSLSAFCQPFQGVTQDADGVTSDVTIPADKTLTLSGTVTGTPADVSGLNLSAMTLGNLPSTLASEAEAQAIVDAVMADPSTNANLNAANWRADLDAQQQTTALDNLSARGVADLSGGSAGDLLMIRPAVPNSTIQTVTLSGDATVDSDGAVTVASASDTAAGKIEVATDAEVQTGTDSARAIVPSALAAWWTWIKSQAQIITEDWNVDEDSGGSLSFTDTSYILTVNTPAPDYPDNWTINWPARPGTLLLQEDAATESASGAVELATDAEVQTGTDSARAIVPSALAAWWTWIKSQANTITNWTIDGDDNTLQDIAPDSLGTYRQIFIPASQFAPRATNGAAAATEEYATNDIVLDYYLFDGTTAEGIQWQGQLPWDWDGDVIKVKFYWDAATGATASDTVEWEISGGAIGNDEVIDVALGTPVAVSDAVTAVGDMHVSADTADVTISVSSIADHLIILQVERDPDGTDDMAEDAKLFGIAIQYTARTSTLTGW